MRATILVPVLGLATLLAFAAPAPRARACSCVARSPAEYVRGADLVFLARAGKERTAAGRTFQPLTVLLPLKGRPGAVYRLSDAGRTPCSRVFTPGEVALVFVTRGHASLCAGNYDLKAVQLERMAEYLRLGRPAPTAPTLMAVRAALETALGSTLHERRRIPVTWAPLAGRQATVGNTTLEFGRNRLKHAVEIGHALASGPVILVEGVYGLTGYAFRVLLLSRGKAGYETLATWGAERKRRGAKSP